MTGSGWQADDVQVWPEQHESGQLNDPDGPHRQLRLRGGYRLSQQEHTPWGPQAGEGDEARELLEGVNQARI